MVPYLGILGAKKGCAPDFSSEAPSALLTLQVRLRQCKRQALIATKSFSNYHRSHCDLLLDFVLVYEI